MAGVGWWSECRGWVPGPEPWGGRLAHMWHLEHRPAQNYAQWVACPCQLQLSARSALSHAQAGPIGCLAAGPSSPLHAEAIDYLMIRATMAPATLLLITLMGCFRGLG